MCVPTLPKFFGPVTRNTLIFLGGFIIKLVMLNILCTCTTNTLLLTFQSEWKTVWILIRWLQKPVDLNLVLKPLKIYRINLGSAGQGLKEKVTVY